MLQEGRPRHPFGAASRPQGCSPRRQSEAGTEPLKVCRCASAPRASPVESGQRLYTYMGSAAMFLAAGFRDVTPPGRARLVMRRTSDADPD